MWFYTTPHTSHGPHPIVNEWIRESEVLTTPLPRGIRGIAAIFINLGVV